MSGYPNQDLARPLGAVKSATALGNPTSEPQWTKKDF